MVRQFLSEKFIYPLLRRFVPGTIKNNSMDKKPSTSIYAITVTDINGREVSLSAYKGKKLLIVNTASECGYTPQYAQLEELHRLHGDKIAVLGFPSNDFGQQEPGAEATILSFCESRYGVSFPLFSKVVVLGENRHPLYAWLGDAALNGWNSQVPTWNFFKYLVDENGVLLAALSSSVSPLDEQITA